MRWEAAALAARILLAVWALAAGAAAIAGPLARRSRARRGEAPPAWASRARPCREGPAALAAILRAAARGSFARERAAARMAALARDVIALEGGLDDEGARVAARSGALDGSPLLSDYIETDYLVAPRGRRRSPWRFSGRRGDRGRPAQEALDFLEKTEDALDELELLRGAQRGGR